jgi:tetratricopeptide (TPR) repeat protein
MFCVNNDCRHELEPDSRFCTQCGTPQPQLVPTAQPERRIESPLPVTVPSNPRPTFETKVEAGKGSAPTPAFERTALSRTSVPADFQFIRDFSMINWKATGQVNLIRAAFAGPVLGLLMAFATGSAKMFFTYAFLFPFMYVVALVPMALVADWLSSRGVPVAGWFAAVLSFMVALGDPFTSMLSRKRPDLVPVEGFGLFNLKPIIFVLNEVVKRHEIERGRAANIDVPHAVGGSPAANEAKAAPETQERKNDRLPRTTVAIPTESGDHKAQQASRALAMEKWMIEELPEFCRLAIEGSEVLEDADTDIFLYADMQEDWEFAKTSGKVDELRSALVHKVRALALYKAKDYAAAISEYRNAAETFPQSRHFRFQLAARYCNAQEFGKAVPLLEELLTTKPEHWDVRFVLAKCCFALKDLDRAIALIEDCILNLSDCRKNGWNLEPAVFTDVYHHYDALLPGGLQRLGIPLSLNRLTRVTTSIDIPPQVADAEFSPAIKVCSAWVASRIEFGRERTFFKVYLFDTENIDDIKRAAQPVAIAEIEFPGQNDASMAEVTLIPLSDNTVQPKRPQGAQQTVPEVAFMSEAAKIAPTESVVDIWNRADQAAAVGNSIEAIRLFNAALRMASLPETEFCLHQLRFDLIVQHFELDGQNKASPLLPHVIAKEHIIRDWEAMIGLWAESSPAFGEDARKQFQSSFDHVYVSYMPMSMGLMAAVTPDGKHHSYEQRVPVKWKIGWITEGLLVNGRLYPQYSSKKIMQEMDDTLSRVKEEVYAIRKPAIDAAIEQLRPQRPEGRAPERMSVQDQRAQLHQLLDMHPHDFRIYSAGDDINEQNLESHGPYENVDPRVIELIKSTLAAGRQLAIVAAGDQKVLLMIAKPGTRLFEGPPGTKLPPFRAFLVEGERCLMEGIQANLAGNHEQGKRFYKDAVIAFEQAERLRPDEASPKLGIAEASAKMWEDCDPKSVLRKIEAAEQLLLQGLSENKVNKFGGMDKVHYLYALCHLALRNRDVAKRHFRETLRINPDHRYAPGILKRVEEEDAR